jgi:hypothetical protein
MHVYAYQAVNTCFFTYPLCNNAQKRGDFPQTCCAAVIYDKKQRATVFSGCSLLMSSFFVEKLVAVQRF